jgi:hypothetical protein
MASGKESKLKSIFGVKRGDEIGYFSAELFCEYSQIRILGVDFERYDLSKI